MKKFTQQQKLLLILTLLAGIAYLFSNKGNLNASNEPFNVSQLSTTSTVNLINNEVESVKNTPDPALVITNWQTSNNIPVFFVQATELPMVDIEVTYKAGSVYSTAKPGVAALTSTMLVEGTKSKSTEQISDIFENAGAVFNAGVSLDSAAVSLRSLTENEKLKKALTLFKDILANANFPEKNFSRVRKNAIEELKLQDQYPENIIKKKFYHDVYKNNPYGIPVAGTVGSLNKIRKSDLVSFYKQYYVSNNAMIAMVGNLDENTAREIAEQIALSIPSGEAAPTVPVAQQLQKSVKDHINFPSTQTHIMVGGLGIQRNDPDYFPLTVGNHVLGTLPLVSLLFKNIRIERGLAYSVSSRFIALQNPGPFFINMQTRTDKVNEALDVTLDTLKKYMQNGPTEAELELAKENLIGGFALGIASNAKKLAVISTIGFYNLPLDYLDTYVDNVKRVTVQDIKTAFGNHLNLNNLAVITVGDNKVS